MEESAQFRELLKLLKIKANRLAAITGISESICYQISNGKRKLSRESLELLVAAYPALNVDWLLRGIGQPFHQIVPQVSEGSKPEYTEWTELDTRITTDASIRQFLTSNLRMMCDRWRLTQQDLYLLLSGEEVSRGAANKLMTGSTSPSMSMLMRMSDLTGVPLFELMSRELSISEIAEEPLRERREVPGVPANELADLFSDLDKLQKRIARILAKYEKNDMDN